MAPLQPVVLFDLDGTLLDVSHRHHLVYATVARSLGGRPLEQHDYWSRKRNRQSWPDILADTGIPQHVDEFLAGFIEHIEDPAHLAHDELHVGAEAVLTGLGARHPLHLVSLRRSHDSFRWQLDQLGIRHHFREIYSGHTEGREGHDTKASLVAEAVGDRPGVLVGDTEVDILASRQLHLGAVAVTWGIRDGGFLATLAPDRLLDRMADVPGAVDQTLQGGGTRGSDGD